MPAFALMGLGFLGCAVLVAFARGDLLVVPAIYALSLVLAWVFTRAQYPIEGYGVVCQVSEVGLAVIGIVLFRRTTIRAEAAAG